MKGNVMNYGYFHRSMRFAGDILIMAFVVLGFTQCESEIELDFSDFQPKLVINAQISADSAFVVVIGESTTPVNPETGMIPESIEVSITDLSTDELVELYRENDKFVTSPSNPVKPGVRYLIKASAPGYEPVQAVTQVPGKLNLNEVLVEDFKVLPSEVTPDKINVSYSLSFSFDVMDESYLHFIFKQYSTLNSGGVNPQVEQRVYPLTPEFPEESGYIRHIDNGVLVSVADVESHPIRFRFNDYTIDALNEKLGILEVEVRTVSPDYYWYFVSLARQIETLKDPFAEPVPVFSNINGGLGNFSGYNTRIVQVTLE